MSNVLRTTLLEKFSKCSDEHCPKDLFEELKVKVYMELKDNCLPNFLRSEKFLSFIDIALKDNPKVLEVLGVKKVDAELDDNLDSEASTEDEENYSMELMYDVNVLEVTDVDFERVLSDARKADLWETVFSSTEEDGRVVKVSKNFFYNGNRGLKKFWECGILPFSLEECFYAYLDVDYYLTIETDVYKKDGMKVIQYNTQEKYATVLIHSKNKLQ